MSGLWLSRYAVAVHRLTRGIGDTVFYGADGQPWFGLDGQRHDVALEQISADLQHAVVAVEDRRFYHHPGIDPIGVVRAVVRDVRGGARTEGGSTLTQQLARTIFLSNVKTFGRKIKEGGIALLIEAQLSKKQILEFYLNRVYLSAGVYGVETMSQHLFRKTASAVTLPEAALIAGLIRAPSALSPWSNYDGALERSHVVLAQMRAQGLITAAQYDAARQVRPRIQPYRQPNDVRAGFAKEYLRQQFRNEFGGDNPPDWQVHTSFLPELQDAAERAVAGGLDRLRRPGLEAALVALDPSTGDILAMVGGANYGRSTYNRAVRSRRQPGSAFKPLVYAAALANGYSPVSVLTNLRHVSAPGDPEWSPHSEGEQADELTLRAALLESNNPAAADLQQRVGSRAVLKLAGNAGLDNLPDVPSLALGTGVVSPLDLTSAYTMFAGGGQVARPRGMISVFDSGGRQVFDQPVDREQLISPAVAFQMTSMLRDVIERGTGAPARALGVRGPVAGKTGTTDGYHDAWFVGYSTSVVVGVWVGFDQPAPIGPNGYGARVALPIWADFMKRTARQLPAAEFTVPPGIHSEDLCSVSYLAPVDGCPIYQEFFKDGDTVPTALCPIHQGSLKQRASRAIEGFFRGLGGKIAGIFGRK
ncbi:MAG TPA: PBP1A family penicillin-binding protein [Vicinamibacterales bacterium]|nr:PBP1A family penicillin-binding protein [Vicinamibacterales bacterium]